MSSEGESTTWPSSSFSQVADGCKKTTTFFLTPILPILVVNRASKLFYFKGNKLVRFILETHVLVTSPGSL